MKWWQYLVAVLGGYFFVKVTLQLLAFYSVYLYLPEVEMTFRPSLYSLLLGRCLSFGEGVPESAYTLYHGFVCLYLIGILWMYRVKGGTWLLIIPILFAIYPLDKLYTYYYLIFERFSLEWWSVFKLSIGVLSTILLLYKLYKK